MFVLMVGVVHQNKANYLVVFLIGWIDHGSIVEDSLHSSRLHRIILVCTHFSGYFSLNIILEAHISAMVNEVTKKHLGENQLLAAACADNAANVQAACARISADENYGCAAHTANLVIGDLIENRLQGVISHTRVCFILLLLFFFVCESSHSIEDCSVLSCFTNNVCTT